MPEVKKAKDRSTKATSPPSGTVTFLFTDIEGSTQRWEAHKAAMANAVAQHDALMREAVQENAGFIFKTVGDAFCASFSRPENAIAAALAGQRAIASKNFLPVGGLHVRMAIHTGTAQERDGDYFGPAVNRVARLLAIGHGGQVLVSGIAADLLQGSLPTQASLRDLGEHQLRDLAIPEQVYQLVGPGLAEIFPPLRSLAVLPNNLPRQAAAFVGREHELSEVKALLAKAPLVTLVGTAGVGKTRMALQVGADLLDGTGDGVWFIELAQLPSGDYIASAIAQAFSLATSSDRDPLDDVLAYLKDKRLLLIFDNCEHVVSAASRVASLILKTCPAVQILATTREGLNLHGEQVYRMPSLPVPPVDSVLAAEEALRYGAVALFVTRASALDAHFSLTDDKAPVVADICRRLDGIALAIELAAARVTILNLKQLSQRLDERFRVLTGGDRTALPRQQTMRAAIDWSYDLLSDEERTLFCRLSIFQGGWTLEAAGEICADESLPEESVLDLLSSLVNKSLVIVEFEKESQRYRFLESLRQYALERLRKAGGFDVIARRHANYFSGYGRSIGQKWTVLTELEWLGMVEAEIDNIRAALQWCLSEGHEPLLGAQLAEYLWPYWFGQLPQEGRRWFETAREYVKPETNLALSVAIDLALSRLLIGFSWRNSVAAGERGLAGAEQLGDERVLARALFYVGEGRVFDKRLDEAELLLNRALELSRRHHDEYRLASVMHLMGRLYIHRKQFDKARESMMAAFRYYEKRGADRNGAIGLIALATLERAVGNAERAITLSEQAIAMCVVIRDTGIEILAECSLGISLSAMKRYDEARGHARRALTMSHDLQQGQGLASSLHLCTLLAYHNQDLEGAARLLGFTQVAELDKPPRSMFFDLDANELTHTLRERLGEERLATMTTEGASWSEDDGYQAALAACERT